MQNGVDRIHGRPKFVEPALVVRLVGIIVLGFSIGELNSVVQRVCSIVMDALAHNGNDHSLSGYVGSILAAVLRHFESDSFAMLWAEPVLHVSFFVVGVVLVWSRGSIFKFLVRRMSRWLTTHGSASLSAASGSS